MPELVEISCFSKILSQQLGNYLVDLITLRGRYHDDSKATINKQNINEVKNFIQKLNNQQKRDIFYKMIQVEQQGKMIVVQLQSKENDMYMIIQMGLSGFISNTLDEKYGFFIFTFKKNLKLKKEDYIYFNDKLRFGRIRIYQNVEDLQKELKKQAPDINHQTQKLFFDKFKDLQKNKIQKNKEIYDILIDQKKLIAGLGVYLGSEVLYQSKISPKRKLQNITDDEIKIIYHSVHIVINRILSKLQIQNIFDNKEQIDEEQIYEQYRQFDFFNVYQKSIDKHENPIIKTKMNTRYAWFCPAVQK